MTVARAPGALLRRGLAKVELGLAKGKRKYDKRAAEKERDWRREKARLLRDKG